VPRAESYYDVLTAAIDDLATNGYDSAERVAYWSQKIKEAAERTMGSESEMERQLREALAAVYKKMIENGGIAKFHQGVGRFTIERVRPQLRAELDRRILAAANLIKLNRKESIEKTLRRFQGWSTSIPKGGSDAVKRREEKTKIRKSLTSLPFEERRCLIDQGHKLTASLSEILAKDGAAIAMVWHSHYRQAGYAFREEHKERDGRVYFLRGCWAQEKGLAKPGPDGYYDEITSVGEEVFCRCWAQWLYALRELPPDMLTKKGEAALDAVRRAA
jgi:hypothetical protein